MRNDFNGLINRLTQLRKETASWRISQQKPLKQRSKQKKIENTEETIEEMRGNYKNCLVRIMEMLEG